MLVNAALGTVLWISYAETSNFLEPRIGNAAIPVSGAIAGGVQALVAAPAENVRLVIEGGRKEGWSHAWKEVFRGTESHTQPLALRSRPQQVHEIREVRGWMREVGEMAGRGWNGWGWGCAKDMFGEGWCRGWRPLIAPSFRLRLRGIFLYLRSHTTRCFGG
jgi:hypothetical protein